MMWQTRSVGSAETERLGEALGRLLKAPAVLELKSDLGGGKTTFVRGLARGMGSPDTVTSPTFVLNNIYHSKVEPWKIHHFDFYRLSEPGLLSDQLQESLSNPKVVTVVEWGKIVEDVLPVGRITVEFMPLASNTDKRQIKISYPEGYISIIKELETGWQEIRP